MYFKINLQLFSPTVTYRTLDDGRKILIPAEEKK